MNLEVDSKDEVMHISMRSVIFKEEMVGGRERVTTDERGKRDMVVTYEDS